MRTDANIDETRPHESTEGVPAKHTRLPWHFSRKFRYVSDTNHRVIAEIAPVHGFEANAAFIVRAVNSHAAMVSALEGVRKIISEGAMTGFNCHDGDWAERLFASQATTSAALKAAKGNL
jgi:hypothetical protein